MIQKSKKGNPVIGRKVKTLKTIENRAGVKIEKGEICEIFQAYRGYGIKTKDNRCVTRVYAFDITDAV